jgi:hypothetical protein
MTTRQMAGDSWRTADAPTRTRTGHSDGLLNNGYRGSFLVGEGGFKRPRRDVEQSVHFLDRAFSVIKRIKPTKCTN